MKFNYSLSHFVANSFFIHLFQNLAFKKVLAESELQRKEFLRKQGKTEQIGDFRPSLQLMIYPWWMLSAYSFRSLLEDENIAQS